MDNRFCENFNAVQRKRRLNDGGSTGRGGKDQFIGKTNIIRGLIRWATKTGPTRGGYPHKRRMVGAKNGITRLRNGRKRVGTHASRPRAARRRRPGFWWRTGGRGGRSKPRKQYRLQEGMLHCYLIHYEGNERGKPRGF